VQFTIPKVTRFLPLQEYAPEEPTLAGVGLQVWVDPPRSVLMEFDSLNRDFSQVLNKLAAKPGEKPEKKVTLVFRLLGWLQVQAKHTQDDHFKIATENHRRSLYGWYARQWSQAPDAATHWTADELEVINNKNPQFYEWLCISSWALIEKHREDVKKGWRGPSEKSPAAVRPATPSSQPTI
jgi:hypothetical protein